MLPGYLIAAICMTLASGCGVSDYQNRLDEQRKRVQEIDEFNSLLDDPIEIPTMQIGASKEDQPAWPFEVFLRLPKGYTSVPKEKAPYNIALFRYSGDDPNMNIFIIAAHIAEPDEKQVFKKYHPKTFKLYVKTALEEHLLKTTKSKVALVEPKEETSDVVKSFAIYPEDAKRILFRQFEYREPGGKRTKDVSVFRVNLHEDAGKQICIIEHRLTNADNKAHDNAFKASLSTLDISADAVGKRSQLKKTRG